MADTCISEKDWGPIHASMYVTEEDTITISGTFYDEENQKSYPGPCYQLAIIPNELLDIKNDRPNRYLHTAKWHNFIKGLWKSVQDNPWFRYQ